jgi:predicted ArsR family transcriptional regulator
MSDVTSAGRNLLRAVAAYEGDVTAAEAARILGISRQLAAGSLAELARAGMLSARRMPQAAYTVTDAGRAELERNQVTCLLVEVDDRLADDLAVYLGKDVSGIVSVSEHGSGCCCKHCPRKGDHG